MYSVFLLANYVFTGLCLSLQQPKNMQTNAATQEYKANDNSNRSLCFHLFQSCQIRVMCKYIHNT